METTKDSIENFLFHCRYEKRLSPKTLIAYKIDLNQFENFIAAKNIYLFSEINRNTLKEFIQKLQEKYKVRSAKRKIACIKALFNHLEYENEDFINPFRKIKLKIKEPFQIPKAMSFSEINKIFLSIYALKKGFNNKDTFSYKSLIRDIAILELLFATGIRVSELTNLGSDNVDLTEGQITVLGKGNKERILQICNKEVLESLKGYKNLFSEEIKDNGYFFVNRWHKRISDQSVRIIVKKYTERSNIEKHITPHTFRHTFATTLLDEGVDIKYIQNLLGHSSILTTQIYTHVSTVKQKKILTEMHPRNRLIIS